MQRTGYIPDEELDDNWTGFDRDGSETLDEVEFTEMMLKIFTNFSESRICETMLEVLWDILDKDNDGVLSDDELEILLKDFNYNINSIEEFVSV